MRRPLKKETETNEAFINRLRKLIILLIFSLLFTAPTDSYGQLFEQRDPKIERTGDVIIFALPASALATTLILKDYKGTWQQTKSLLLNQAVTVTMKVLINKRRPFQGGDYAFPSGHTSTAFQAASFYHRRYGFKYSIPGYVLAGFTGFSRLNAEKHDGWDILAGAVVGIGSTLFFTKPYREKDMQLTFTSGEGAYMLGFRYNF